MSAGQTAIESILDVILDVPTGAVHTALTHEQPDAPWYEPPAHLSYVVGTDSYQQWQCFWNWKQACNEVAALCGEPLPFPPKKLPKGPTLKLRAPPAFSFKDTAATLASEIEQLRTSYATESELRGLDDCMGGPECCAYHNRMKELGRILPAGVSQLDQDMERGKPFVPHQVQKS